MFKHLRIALLPLALLTINRSGATESQQAAGTQGANTLLTPTMSIGDAPANTTLSHDYFDRSHLETFAFQEYYFNATAGQTVVLHSVVDSSKLGYTQTIMVVLPPESKGVTASSDGTEADLLVVTSPTEGRYTIQIEGHDGDRVSTSITAIDDSPDLGTY